MTMKKIKDKIAQYLKDKTFLRYLLYSIYIVITTCVLFVFLTHPAIRGFFASIENKTFDIRQNILSPYKKVNKNILIAGRGPLFKELNRRIKDEDINNAH